MTIWEHLWRECQLALILTPPTIAACMVVLWLWKRRLP